MIEHIEDLQLLEILFMDSRSTLKDLSTKLGLKTNFIKKRLEKLEEHVIDSFSLVFDPEKVGISQISLIKVYPKSTYANSLEGKSLETLGSLLIEENLEILFCSVSRSYSKYSKKSVDVEFLLNVFVFVINDEHQKEIIKNIENNPLVDTVDIVNFSLKTVNHRFFTFEKGPISRKHGLDL